ncbi:MAG: NAD-dependent epimerase/dehydratase family protein [Chloroflexota bacterium]
MSNLLVTGVAGFIGQHVACLFSRQGYEVIGIDILSPGNVSLAGLNLSHYFQLQLPDANLSEILKGYEIEACIHCAGRASIAESVSDPVPDFYGGVPTTFEILNALRLHRPKSKFVFLSSAAVYGNPERLPIPESTPVNPISPYGFHKLQCELLCKEFSQVYGLRTASLRIFSAYGPGLRRQVVWDIFQKALTNRVLRLQGTGNESRDFIHVEDISGALMNVVKYGLFEGEVYNVATGREVKISELAEIILMTLEIKKPIIFDGIVPAGVPQNWRADISKLQDLGFFPTIVLEQGIKDFVKSCRREIK